MYRLALAHFDVYTTDGKQTARFELPYNDVAPSDYCFYDVISATDSLDDLTDHVSRLGFTEDETDYGDIENRYRSITITASVPIVETTEKYSWPQKQALVWVKIPDTESLGLEIQEKIAPLTDAQWESYNSYGNDYMLGVERYGEDLNGNAAVIIENWDFYLFAPLFGYTWQSVLHQFGVEGDDPAPFGFSDDSDSCGECGVIDSRDDGYTYNFRESPSGNYVGVNCGCFDAACESEYRDNANDADKTINLDLARKLAGQGKLKFVRRYIGGMTDPGRGGSFYIESDASDGEKAAVNYDDEACFCPMHVENGDPSEILKQLLADDADNQYVFSHDESGQFQTYFSVWQLIEGDAK